MPFLTLTKRWGGEDKIKLSMLSLNMPKDWRKKETKNLGKVN